MINAAEFATETNQHENKGNSRWVKDIFPETAKAKFSENDTE